MIEKIGIKEPFFIFNPKSYLYGEGIVEMARVAEEMAVAYPEVSIFITCPFADIAKVAAVTEKAIVCAQHIDGIKPGRGMGHVLPEAVYASGARASFLNHAERSLTLDELVWSVNRANELGILTIVCANSLPEARAIATLEPDIVLCEPTELIGTGKTSDVSYITDTNRIIREISPKTLVMQAAGISSPQDVYDVIQLGASGTGCTSGITEAENPKQMLRDMVAAAAKASRNGGVK